MSLPPPEPTLEHYKLLRQLRAKRPDADDLLELTTRMAAQAIADSEQAAVQRALTTAKAKEKSLRQAIDAMQENDDITALRAGELRRALQ